MKVVQDLAVVKKLSFTKQGGSDLVFNHYEQVLKTLRTLGRSLKAASKSERTKNADLKGNKDNLRRQE